jgi:hypothetical protein
MPQAMVSLSGTGTGDFAASRRIQRRQRSRCGVRGYWTLATGNGALMVLAHHRAYLRTFEASG